MLEAVHTDLVFTISLKRSTQNLQLSTSSPADYPIFISESGLSDRRRGMSGLGHNQTFCDAVGTPLFDYFVGGGEHGLWERKTERFGRFQIDD